MARYKIRRYWVNLGNWYREKYADEIAKLMEKAEIAKLMEKAEKELLKLDVEVEFGPQQDLIYKTYDLTLARNIVTRAKEIVEEIFGEEWTDFWGQDLHIVSQPDCEKCGYFGRFSDLYCSRCGRKLKEKEFIED